MHLIRIHINQFSVLIKRKDDISSRFMKKARKHATFLS